MALPTILPGACTFLQGNLQEYSENESFSVVLSGFHLSVLLFFNQSKHINNIALHFLSGLLCLGHQFQRDMIQAVKISFKKSIKIMLFTYINKI